MIEKAPSDLKLSEDCKYFFLNKKYKLNELKINKLLNLYNFLELFLYINLIETLNYKYKGKISKEKQKEIEVKLKEYIYIKKDLAVAIRKFITRYLLENDDINENGDLADKISREDLWDEEILNKGNLNSILDKLREIKLKVGQAYEFYELINQEDKKIIEEYEKIRRELKKEKKIKEENGEKYIIKEEENKKEEKKEENIINIKENITIKEENKEKNEEEKEKEKEDNK